MQSKLLSSDRHRSQAMWMLSFFLLPLVASASFTAVLQGHSKNDTNWISANLMNWQEMDYITVRVSVKGGAATGRAIHVDFVHANGTKPGVQNLTAFTTSPNVIITSGPT